MTLAHHAVPLTGATAATLKSGIRTPDYRRDGLRRAIIHLGVGGFHRAHLASYVDDLCRSGSTDWSIVGAGVLPGDRRMANVLGAQDGLYTLITRGPTASTVEVIGSIVDYLHAHPSAEALIATIAAADTQIVSLTVTEGGYPVDDTTGVYVPTSSTAGPGSAFAVLAAGLARRRALGLGGVTVISCDNILGNGRAALTATIGEAERIDEGLARWIEASTAFPNGMVDRITPATTDADRAWLAEKFGLLDGWPVVTEPFRQWVLEDTFASDRLPLEILDVLATSDVEPYELMKLRLLNASHSCMAYLASLAGIDRVDEAMADDAIRSLVVEFLSSEARPALPAVVGVDLGQYVATLVERFSNPAIGDQIPRLCLDGSSKFPKFLLPTVRAQLAANGPIALSALALAGWCEYLAGDRRGLAFDPLLDEATTWAARSKEDPAAFLSFHEVFGDLARADRFVDSFAIALGRLRTMGPRVAIAESLREERPSR